jgi:fructose-1,6-bisphosphatase
MMAHEVNNTIGAVNSIVSTIQAQDPSKLSEESDEIISMLEVAVQRNHQLNRFMQNFSNVVKLPLPDKTEFDLCKSIQSVVRVSD